MRTVAKKVVQGIDVLATVLISGVITLTIIQVLSRHVFNLSLNWTEELARYFYVWATFFGAVVAFRLDKHIRILFLLDALPKRTRSVVEIAIHVFTFVFLCAVLVGSLKMIKATWYVPSASMPGFQIGYVYLVFPLTIPFIMGYLFCDIFRHLRGLQVAATRPPIKER